MRVWFSLSDGHTIAQFQSIFGGHLFCGGVECNLGSLLLYGWFYFNTPLTPNNIVRCDDMVSGTECVLGKFR